MNQDFKNLPAIIPEAVEHSSTEAVSAIPGGFSPLPCRRGALRGDHTVLDAATDGEAVAVWLKEKAGASDNTAKRYRREAERLLLWASQARDKCLSELTREDYIAYGEFLQDPQPRDQWVMDKRRRRDDPRWRPFLDGLSPDSILHSQRIIYSLVSYLVDTGWLRANPMPAPRGSGRGGFQPVKRSLNHDQWEAIRETLSQRPRQNRKELLYAERDQWLVGLFYDLGLRISEVANHPMGAFVAAHDNGKWALELRRKGDTQASLPVPKRTIERLKRFRRVLDLPPYPAPGETIPLAPRFGPIKPGDHLDPYTLHGLSANRIYRLVGQVFEDTAARIESEDAHSAQRLRRASTHWLRHTALKRLTDSSGDLRLVQMLASHADINTTAGYVTEDDAALRTALDELDED